MLYPFQDIFVSLCTVDDSLYFMCNLDDFKFLADMIQHVPLPLRARYVFCCAPINRKLPYVCTMFLKVSIIFLLIIRKTILKVKIKYSNTFNKKTFFSNANLKYALFSICKIIFALTAYIYNFSSLHVNIVKTMR